MADNRLSWSELRRALALRANVKESEANTFLNAFQSQLVEALKKDKQVKINGLGTFRLQSVAPRKSVNVTTGEEIIIDGYNKITFAPEVGVKELVEKGASELGATAAALGINAEVKEKNDPLRKLGEQAEEIIGILDELGQKPNSEPMKKSQHKKETPVEKPIDKGEEKPVEKTEEKTIEKPAEIIPNEPVKEQVPETEQPKPEQPEVEKPKPVQPKKEQPKQEQPKKRFHFIRDTLICVVILLMLLLVGYFFLRSKLSGWIEGLVNNEPQTELKAEAPKQTNPVNVKDIKAEEKQEDIRVYKEWMLTEKLTEGSRLAWLAKKHYGNKVYWPYIYDANRDKINNPSKIIIGTPIRVPKLTKTQLDTTSAQFIKLKKEAERDIANK